MLTKKQAYRCKYYLAHREKELSNNREYIKKNRARLSVLAREWTRRNKDRLNALQRERYAKDRTRWRNQQKRYDASLKRKLLEVYGDECACCHEKDKRFLSLGHVKNDGFLDRQKYNNMARAMYVQAIKNPDPTRYGIQCYNCNMGARLNGGLCPHKTRKAAGG